MYAVKLMSDVESIFDYDTPTSRPSYLMPVAKARPGCRRNNRTSLADDLIHGRRPPTSIVDRPANTEGQLHVGEPDALARERRRLAARLRLLKRLPVNHDGDGAHAPIASSVDAALTFLPLIETESRFGVTLDDDGHAVVEFFEHSNGAFTSLTFTGENGREIECYRRSPGSHSAILRGGMGSDELSVFLRDAGVIA